jgi:hypothetical protein
MEPDDSGKSRAVPFAGEYLRRYEALFFGNGARAIKDWRTMEFEAGRPSGLSDYGRTHGLCPGCRGIGIALNENGNGHKAIGWDGNVQLYDECESCGGTGTCS